MAWPPAGPLLQYTSKNFTASTLNNRGKCDLSPMIGTDEMSSTSMDISESFRAEDLSKTDFFDFVSGAPPDLGIGIGVGVGVGVGVSLHTHAHHQHHHQSHHHQQQQHQQQHSHDRISSRGSMTHDGGGGAVDSGGGNGSATSASNGNTSGDNPLQSYEFWHTDKDQSRLESTIFEDLDRYCWQQHTQQQQPPSATNAQRHQQNPASAPTSPVSLQQMHHQQQQQQQLHNVNASNLQHHHLQNSNHNGSTPTSSSGAATNASVSANSNNNSNNANNTNGALSSGTVSSIDANDGQIYTLTVLNSNEPWLKPEPNNNTSSSAATTDASQLPTSLDLDTLLGNFSGYIKTEYPYDDSGFSTDGAKDGVGNGVVGGDVVHSTGISIPQMTATHHGMQTLPSLVTAISTASGGGGIVTTAGNNSNDNANINQRLEQFQNNNNDWHMADHNAAQNSAESLLRSALQGKGYGKGLHMQPNGITLLPGSPTTVKEDEMRRILFPSEADSLTFADSTLSATPLFDDAHSAHLVSGGGMTSGNPTDVQNIMVDDMFLSLESDYSDDYEKIKRIANEVQQFCSSAVVASGEYGSGTGADVLMQISPSPGLTSAVQQQQQLHSPLGTPTGISQQHGTPNTAQHMQQTAQQTSAQKSQVRPEVVSTTTHSSAASRVTLSGGIGKPAKKYKRLTNTTQSQQQQLHNQNNNNNPGVMNHNNGPSHNGAASVGGAVVNGNSSSASSTNSSNSPTHCNGGSGGTGATGGGGGGQRKERSLHYCSICSKGFKDKYSVNVHIRTHTGEKPFACSLCGKSFRQKAHLAKHYQTHMAQKNNGTLIKGGGGGGSNSGKHRNRDTAAQRQLSTSTGGGIPPVSVLSSAAAVAAAMTLTATPTAAGGLTVPATPTILPPANGLLANR